MFTFLWRTVLRNVINLGHHLVIVVAVLLWFGAWKQANPAVALVGVVFLALNVSWMSMLAAIASARFRDIPQIVASVMQFAFFMTPVFWQASKFGDKHAFLTLNPFYHMLEAVRAPLLGAPVSTLSYTVLAVMALGGWALTFSVFAVTRRRIVHYL
ncbi:ABC transporter permease [Phenylobacterium sp.]|jgi:ABC-type polysaccharide/polyol phosphate export permease|uniref:ABC transporter permease n=1 Tax=Phenylobacterium sp. TaxID=1871053 RepID=UPI002F94DDB2